MKMDFDFVTPIELGVIIVNIIILFIYTKLLGMVHKKKYKEYGEEIRRQYRIAIEEAKHQVEIDVCNRENLELYPENCPHYGRKIT